MAEKSKQPPDPESVLQQSTPGSRQSIVNYPALITQPTRPQNHKRECEQPRSTCPTLNQQQSNLYQSPRPTHRPQFSLAGPYGYAAHGPSYVAPGYRELNPGYQQEHKTPVWGLAKPLPRVLRPGMKRGHEEGVVEDEDAEVRQPGSSEAIPQLGMINDQRHEAGISKIDTAGTKNSESRGYGNQNPRKTRKNPPAPRIDSRSQSEASAVGRVGTPGEERENPMEQWRQESYRSSPGNLSENNADIGEMRSYKLPEIQEMHGVQDTSARDVFDTDLEAGDKYDTWVPDRTGEDQSVKFERDAQNKWTEVRERFREPLAECLATMVAVLIGLCTSLSVTTSNNTAGSYQSENWAWGFGVMIGVYLAGGISGGHLNPAITLTLCLYRGFPLHKALFYIAAQIFGGFLAGLIAYAIYQDAIFSFDAQGGMIAVNGGSTAAVGLYDGGTGKSFYTQPRAFASAGAGFGNELVASAILSCAILALGDDSNAPPGAGMHAFIVGLVIAVLTMAFGYTSGACLNPARDFGPRVATAIVGYGSRVFTDSSAWWTYGAWGATITGGLVGGLLYDVVIFVGGESPVNYPREKQRKAKRKAKRKWWGLKRNLEKGAAKKPVKGR